MYAQLSDMVERYGEAEILRLGVIDGDFATEITDLRVEARIARAIVVASDQVDSYLRKRHATPLLDPPVSVVEAACVLARFWLSSNGGTSPSEDVASAQKRTIAWLTQISRGEATLEGSAAMASGSEARISDRPKIFDPGAGGMW